MVSEKRLFIVSNRLPLTVEQQDGHYQSRQSSGGLIAAMNAFLNRDGNDRFTHRFWAGIPGCTKNVWEGLEDNDQADFTYLPVFVDETKYERYYDGFSNSLLWPLFHYFPSYTEYHDKDFKAYMAVNKQIADRLIPEVRAGDTIWIHDYHLLPLAGLLRRRSPGLSIGLFLHIPFPVFEVFRLIPKTWQRNLLTGMLGADLIGFHTPAYEKYFRQSVEYVLQVKTDNHSLSWDGRQIETGTFPVSIDFEQFHQAARNEKVQELIKSYQHLKEDKKLLFSVDRLDYTKGVHNRIKGYKKFLVQHPEYCGKVTFILVIVPSRDHIKTYAERKRIIDEYIGNLNSSMGTIDWKPVIYQYQHLEFEELVALYNVCDAAVITPLRDGMNLVAKEFVASRNDGKGVLILSEMTGAASELDGAILINPNDTAEIGSAIKRALEMEDAEQQERLSVMQSHLSRYDVSYWAASFLNQLEQIKSQQSAAIIKMMDPFSRARLLEKYTAANKRLLLLDYDGTLTPFTAKPEMATPSNELLDLLAQLSADNNNDIYIISGRDSKTLESWLGHLPVGIVAEHGAKIKFKGSSWTINTTNDLNDYWPRIEELMQKYVSQCPQSFIEMKEFSRAWHYREADNFIGKRKAKTLYDELLYYSNQVPLSVLNGHKVIEVRGQQTNKGNVAKQLLSTASYDFVMCIGDDATDEDMFKAMANIPQAFNIKVGQGSSFASYRLLTPYQVHSLLQNIINSPHAVSVNTGTDDL